MSALLQDVANYLPGEFQDYDYVKTRVISIHQRSRQGLDQALEAMSLESMKPSIFFFFQKTANCHLNVHDEFLPHKFCQAVLNNMGAALSGHFSLN